jgi:Domain of unknown function (DUF4214)
MDSRSVSTKLLSSVVFLASAVLANIAFGQALIIAPNPIAFGQRLIQTTTDETATVSNLGAGSVSVASLGIVGDKGFTRSGGTCPTVFPATIAAGTSCTVVVRFAPTAPGAGFGGTLEIVANTGNSSIAISGSAVAPGVPPTPSVSTLDFGLSANGNFAFSQSVTFTNTSTSAVNLISLSGAPFSVSAGIYVIPPGYYAPSGTCLQPLGVGILTLIPSLAAGASCTLGLSSALGAVVGNYDTTMTLVTSAGNSTVNVKAKIGPITYPIVVTPATLNLTRATVSAATAVGTITLANPGPVIITIAAIVVPAPFQRVGGTCPSAFPAQLAIGASCTVTLHVPAGAGAGVAPPTGADFAKAIASAVAPIIADTGNVDVTLTLDTLDADTDNDGMPDAVERTEGRDPSIKDNMLFGADPSSKRWFVMQQYRDFLGREAEAVGLNDWSALLNTNAMSREAVIQGFFGSPEFQTGVPSIVRLYLGFFNRIPDSNGLRGWVATMRGGASIASIATSFASSAEFTQTYGALSNAQFVTLVYQNVLGRAPDANGNAGWLAQLNNGVSRGQVMTGFTESLENQMRTAPNVFVIMMYEAMLRRAADPAGYLHWVDYINRGQSALDITRGFLVSAEYHYRFLP